MPPNYGPELGQTLGGIVVFIAVVTAVFSYVLFTLVDGSLMKICQWGTVGRCLADAGMANAITTAIGAGFLLALSARPLLTAFIPVLVITWAWSLLVKGGVLLYLKRQSVSQTLRTALVANTVSYAIWSVFFVGTNSPHLF